MVRNFSYFLKQGFKNIWENRMMSLASVGIVAASLLLFGMFVAAGLNINSVLEQIQDQCEINVYLTKDAGGMSLEQIGKELNKIPGVKEVRFYSREDRLQKVREEAYAGREYMLEDVEEDNPLRDSYILTLEDLSGAETVCQEAMQITGVEEVTNRQDVVNKVLKVTGIVRQVGIWMTVLLALIAMFIIANTIKLGMSARQQEVLIMRFVGASNGYIRGPFMVEGILLGAVGSSLAAVLCLWGYWTWQPRLNALIQNAMLHLVPYQDIWLVLLLSFWGIGISIGLIGSIVALRKFLKA